MRIESVIKQTGLSQSGLCDYIGVKSNVYTKWKYEDGRSYLRYVDKIAEFLCVSTEYLLKSMGLQQTGKMNEGREKLYLELFSSLSVEKQDVILETLRFMNKLQEFENEENYEN